MSLRITFAISHFERLDHLRFLYKCLTNINDPNHEMVIFDDCSQDIVREKIKEVFPNAFDYIFLEKNVGASLMIYKMLEHFYFQTHNDFIFLLDSDLYIQSGIIKVLEKMTKCDLPVVSFYNSFHHPRSQFIFKKGTLLVEKKTLGAAGMLISRKWVGKILQDVPPSNHDYDWHISAYFEKENVAMFSTFRSYIQHFGFIGSNNTLEHFDHAQYFFTSVKEDNILSTHIKSLLSSANVDKHSADNFLLKQQNLLINKNHDLKTNVIKKFFYFFN